MLLVAVPALAADYPSVRSGFDLHRAVSLLSNPIVIVAALAFFMNTGVENTMGNWITSFGTALGYSDRAANMLLSAFWISTMLARLAAASVVTVQTGAVASAIMATVVLAALWGMSVTASKPLAGLLVLAVGLMIGPITPTVTGLMFSKLDPGVFGSAFAVFFTVGLMGATSIPASVGVISRRRPIQRALAVPMAAALLIGLFTLLLNTLQP